MSELRAIMQRLGQRLDHQAAAPPAGAPERPPADLYVSELEHCSDAMLHYEWNWLEQHLQDLALCRSNEAMLKAAGGQQHLNGLIAQSEHYAAQLQKAFAQRALVPCRQPHNVAPSEHAWELSNPGLRAQWGFEPRANPGAPGVDPAS